MQPTAWLAPLTDHERITKLSPRPRAANDRGRDTFSIEIEEQVAITERSRFTDDISRDCLIELYGAPPRANLALVFVKSRRREPCMVLRRASRS